MFAIDRGKIPHCFITNSDYARQRLRVSASRSVSEIPILHRRGAFTKDAILIRSQAHTNRRLIGDHPTGSEIVGDMNFYRGVVIDFRSDRKQFAENSTTRLRLVGVPRR